MARDCRWRLRIGARWLAVIRGLVQRATARWITPLSSRTLPGQSCRCRASRASRVKPTTSLWYSWANAARKCSASNSMSLPRCRSGGTIKQSVLMR